jgi:hypothetical protein
MITGTSYYAAPMTKPVNKVQARVRQGDNTYTLRQMSESNTYLLRLGHYNNDWYVAAGSQSENKVYVYKNPLDTLKSQTKQVLVPVQILKVSAPTYVSFSTNARFVMAENADHFAVYDAETKKGYAYQIKTPLDTGQAHAVWMDGFRMSVTSGAKLQVFEFDGANEQTLEAANPAFTPFFDRNYGFVYTFNAAQALTSTDLVLQ